MATTNCFEVCSTILHENIDGEAIALDMTSGSYFSLQASAALIWALVEQSASTEQIVAQVTNRYTIARKTAELDVVSFLSTLQDAGLVTACSQPTKAAVVAVPVDMQTQPYVPPTLETFTDVQDLLTIDPIHDVDEMGWPQTRQAA